jgi:hypothetical protein
MGDIMETKRLADLLSLFYNYEGCEEALMYRDLLAMIKGSAYVALGGLKRMVEGILENKLRLDFPYLTCAWVGDEFPWEDEDDW